MDMLYKYVDQFEVYLQFEQSQLSEELDSLSITLPVCRIIEMLWKLNSFSYTFLCSYGYCQWNLNT